MNSIALEDLLGANKPRSVWDKYVPIVETPTGYKVYFTDDFVDPEQYNEACHTIESAHPHQVVELIINSGGGNPDSAFMVVDSIKATKAKVVARLSGTVASAATIVALSCPKIVVNDNISFMVHNYSASHSGDAHKLKSLQEFFDNEFTGYFREIYKGFLTEQELDKIFVDAKNHWMNSEEVRNRLKQRAEFFKSKTKKEVQ